MERLIINVMLSSRTWHKKKENKKGKASDFYRSEYWERYYLFYLSSYCQTNYAL